MDINVAAIEIKNNNFKLILGYLYENKINVLYKKTYNLNSSNRDGDIYNLISLSNDLKQIRAFEDKKLRINIEINEVVLIIPPYGLEVFETEKTTNTISSDGKIEKVDISNVLSMVKKTKLQNPNNIIVDIIPNAFSTDGNRVHYEPPIGIQSSSILINAHVYTLPQKIVNDLKKAVDNAGLKVKRVVISPIGANSLIELNKESTDKYVLIDYNQDNTTVSFFGKGHLYGSKYFSIGGDEITKDIANTFEISYQKAEEIKRIYGLDLHENVYNNSILKVQGEDGIVRKHTKEELNIIINQDLESWSKYLNNALSTLLDIYGNLKDRIPFYFIGNATKLNGFKDFIAKNYPNNPVKYFVSKSVGASEPGDVNCLGAIAFASTYKGSLEDNSKVEIKKIKREEEKYTEEEDEL